MSTRKMAVIGESCTGSRGVSGDWQAHQIKVDRIVRQLANRTSHAPVSIRKKTVSHEVPKLQDKRRYDEKIDISDLNQILSIDIDKRIAVAEPGVTCEQIVRSTLPFGLVPMEVSEFRSITLGGAIAGCSIESMSFQYGGFHDSCLQYEVVTAQGDVLICTPENENSLVFQMMHGTFGTLGIITLIHFKLISAKPFVKVIYEHYSNLDDYCASIMQHTTDRDVDFMDGIIHKPDHLVLSVGCFVEDAPYTHRYDWMRVYYQSTVTRAEDYLRTPDYYFRYNRGVTNVYPRHFLFRLLFGRLIHADSVLTLADRFARWIPEKAIPVTVDTFIPISRIGEFLTWYSREINHFPLWCVPYKRIRDYEWVARSLWDQVHDDLFLDIAIYGLRHDQPERIHRMLEEKLMSIGAIKTLISVNQYSEEEFWSLWNREQYQAVKQLTDPDNIFRDLYEKTCLAFRGQGR